MLATSFRTPAGIRNLDQQELCRLQKEG